MEPLLRNIYGESKSKIILSFFFIIKDYPYYQVTLKLYLVLRFCYHRKQIITIK